MADGRSAPPAIGDAAFFGAAAAVAAVSETLVKLCPLGHDLQEAATDGSIERSCDRCGWVLLVGEHCLSCPDCAYDVCSVCFLPRLPDPRALPRCPDGHLLRAAASTGAAGEGAPCGSCGAAAAGGQVCSVECGFALCPACADKWCLSLQVGDPVKIRSERKLVALACRDSRVEGYRSKLSEYQGDLLRIAGLRRDPRGSWALALCVVHGRVSQHLLVPCEALIPLGADPAAPDPASESGSAQCTSALCPNGHPLHGFNVPRPGWECDACGAAAPSRGELMFGCRLCEFDVCLSCLPGYRACWQVGDSCTLTTSQHRLELACLQAGVALEALQGRLGSRCTVKSSGRAPGTLPDASAATLLRVEFAEDGLVFQIPADVLDDSEGLQRSAPPVPREPYSFSDLAALRDWEHPGLWRQAGLTVWRFFCSTPEKNEGPICRHSGTVLSGAHWSCCGLLSKAKPCMATLAPSFEERALPGAEDPDRPATLDAPPTCPVRFPAGSGVLYTARGQQQVHLIQVFRAHDAAGAVCADSVASFAVSVWTSRPAAGYDPRQLCGGVRREVAMPLCREEVRLDVRSMALIASGGATDAVAAVAVELLSGQDREATVTVGGVRLLRTVSFSRAADMYCPAAHRLEPAEPAPGAACDTCGRAQSEAWLSRSRCARCDYDICDICDKIFVNSNVRQLAGAAGKLREVRTDADGSWRAARMVAPNADGTYRLELLRDGSGAAGEELPAVLPKDIRAYSGDAPDQLLALNHLSAELIVQGTTVSCERRGCRRWHTGAPRVVLDARCGTEEGAPCDEEGFCSQACKEAWHGRHRLQMGDRSDPDVERDDPDWVMVHHKGFNTPFSVMQKRLREVVSRDEAKYYSALAAELERSPAGVVESIGPPLWPAEVPPPELKARARQPAHSLAAIYGLALAALLPLYRLTASIGRRVRAHTRPLWSLKGPRRVKKKTFDDEPDSFLAGDFSATSDVARTSLHVDSLQQVADATALLRDASLRDELAADAGIPAGGLQVVRIKNRFAEPCPGGYMDVLANVKIGDNTEGRYCVAEIQIHLQAILSVKKQAGHQTYKWVRRYLRDSEEVAPAEGRGRTIDAQGNIYEGEFRKGLRHGTGERRCAEGSVYTGEWRNGLEDGYGRWRTPDEAYEGHWRRGQMHGFGEYYVTRGDNRDIQYRGEYADGRRSGRGTYWYGDGHRYEGEYVYGAPHGKGTMYRPNGTVVFDGDWQHGRPEVPGVIHSSRSCRCPLAHSDGGSLKCGGCGVAQPPGARMWACSKHCGLVLCSSCAQRHDICRRRRLRQALLLCRALHARRFGAPQLLRYLCAGFITGDSERGLGAPPPDAAP